MSDLVHALRVVRKSPVLAAVVMLSLAAGIGVNTTVFSWVQAIILQPLPGGVHRSRFYAIEPRAETGSYPRVSWPEYRDLRERLRQIGDPLAFRMVPLNVGETAHTERTYGLLVSANYFPALGLKPALGRFLRADEAATPGGAPVVVISYDYWQTRYGGSPDALGRTIRVNDHPLAVVGVAPEHFQGTVISLAFDMWLPATLAPVVLNGSRELDDRTQRGYNMMAKLAPGAVREQAQADLAQAMRELAAGSPATNATMTADLVPFWRATRGPQRMLGDALIVLQGVMLLLLLAVCGNTANLMLARASARQREIGVRLALGAGR